jgi:SAM-dependent methyltransferase
VTFHEIVRRVDAYFTAKLEERGPTPGGADWNSAEAQLVRFRELLKVCDGEPGFSINDYGCGYGALLTYLTGQGRSARYFGFDVSKAMIEAARRLHRDEPWQTFVAEEGNLPVSDYTVASGILNIKLDVPVFEWETYALDLIARLDRLSRKGFAFNALTKYSDPDRMRPDLYYADPCFLFDHCVRSFSRHVSLLHDYGPYDFTIIVRKEPARAVRA